MSGNEFGSRLSQARVRRLLVLAAALAVALCLGLIVVLTWGSDDHDGGTAQDDRRPASEAPLTDEEVLFYVLDTTGCGGPVEQHDYPRDRVDMYSCHFNRAWIYLTETPSDMDAFIASAPCQREITYVRGDRWYLGTGEDALAGRLVRDGAKLVRCGSASPSPPGCAGSQTTASVAPEAAARAAKATVVSYIRVLGDVMRDPEIPMARLRMVAACNLLKGDRYIYGGARDYGTREGGRRAKVRHPSVVRMDLENTDPTDAYGHPYVVVEACRDTSGVKLMHISGKEPSLPYPPGTYMQRYTVALTEDGWRVFSRRDLKPRGRCWS